MAGDVDEQLVQPEQDEETAGDEDATITRTGVQVVEFDLLVDKFSKKNKPRDQSEL